MPRRLSKKEERKWARLHIAIPVFVRSRDDNGKDSLEFATAINISPGGALVLVRRSLPQSAVISLEIPSAPLAALAELPTVTRNLRAKVLRTQHGEGFNLVGLKFSRPLASSAVPAKVSRRKVASSV